MEKLNVAERRTYVAPELSIAEFAIENGFGNSVAYGPGIQMYKRV
jgi:hypothetical protein